MKKIKKYIFIFIILSIISCEARKRDEEIESNNNSVEDSMIIEEITDNEEIIDDENIIKIHNDQEYWDYVSELFKVYFENNNDAIGRWSIHTGRFHINLYTIQIEVFFLRDLPSEQCNEYINNLYSYLANSMKTIENNYVYGYVNTEVTLALEIIYYTFDCITPHQHVFERVCFDQYKGFYDQKKVGELFVPAEEFNIIAE